MESIFTFIADQYPTIGLMIVVAVISFFAARYHFSIQRTRKTVEALPCDENGKKIDATARILDALASKVDNLQCGVHRKAIVNIENTLLSKRMFAPSLSASLSPKRLSEHGRELYQISGIQTVLENHLQHFIEKIEAFAPKTALDAQNLSLHVIFNSTDEDFFIPVKNLLFNNPSFDDSGQSVPPIPE